MKTFARVFALCALVVAGAVYAQDLHPIPDMSVPSDGSFVVSDSVPLYTNVKYKDLDEMSPCAQPKIIEVKDPCACRHACDCCGPKCVYIQICVPTCGCELISCRRNGDRIRYDYGKYAIDVRVKKGFIEVDYQD